jgi:hypothetical protein
LKVLLHPHFHLLSSERPILLHLCLTYLKGKGVTCRANNRSLDGRGSNRCVVVWNSGQGSGLGSVGTGAEVIASGDSIAGVSAVERLLAADEDVVLNEDLGTVTGVNSIRDGVVVVVEDVAGTEADGWTAGVDVVPVAVACQYDAGNGRGYVERSILTCCGR